MKGHAEHDNQSYVPPSLIEEWTAKDPVVRFEQSARRGRHRHARPTSKRSSRASQREVDAATDEAERSPMPHPEEAQWAVRRRWILGDSDAVA